jgi:hypothetical protein
MAVGLTAEKGKAEAQTHTNEFQVSLGGVETLDSRESANIQPAVRSKKFLQNTGDDRIHHEICLLNVCDS